MIYETQAPTRTLETTLGTFIAEFEDLRIHWGRIDGVRGGTLKSVEPVRIRGYKWDVHARFYLVRTSGNFAIESSFGTPQGDFKVIEWPRTKVWSGAHRDLVKAVRDPILDYLEDPQVQEETLEYKRLTRIEYLRAEIARKERDIERTQAWLKEDQEEIARLGG